MASRESIPCVAWSSAMNTLRKHLPVNYSLDAVRQLIVEPKLASIRQLSIEPKGRDNRQRPGQDGTFTRSAVCRASA
jgi:hypothetical protein